MMTALHEDNLFAVIMKVSLGLLAIFAVLALIFFSPKTALGVLAGGGIAVVNFFWMRTTLQRILGVLPSNPGRHGFLRYIGRITVTGFAIYFVLTSGLFSLSGILTGLSVIAVTIIILSLYRVISGTGG